MKSLKLEYSVNWEAFFKDTLKQIEEGTLTELAAAEVSLCHTILPGCRFVHREIR